MRLARIENAFGIENIHWNDMESKELGPGEVMVRMRATSLNFRDYLVAVGKYNPKMPLPRVPLSDGAGTIVERGPGATKFEVGTRVAGTFMQSWLSGPYLDHYGKSALGGAIDGVLAEEVILDQEGLVEIPPQLSFEEAATLPCAAVTAWNALFESGNLKAGDTVLVQGSGGVSLFALQFAKAAGARVVATSSSPEKLERLKSMGADSTMNYRESPDWGKKISNSGGVDHVIEVGGPASLEQSLMAVRGGGSVSMIGILSGVQGELNIAPILHKHLTVQGIYVGSRTMFEHMLTAITQNGIRPVIDSVFEGPRIQEALRHIEGAGHFGKIVVSL